MPVLFPDTGCHDVSNRTIYHLLSCFLEWHVWCFGFWQSPHPVIIIPPSPRLTLTIKGRVTTVCPYLLCCVFTITNLFRKCLGQSYMFSASSVVSVFLIFTSPGLICFSAHCCAAVSKVRPVSMQWVLSCCLMMSCSTCYWHQGGASVHLQSHIMWGIHTDPFIYLKTSHTSFLVFTLYFILSSEILNIFFNVLTHWMPPTQHDCIQDAVILVLQLCHEQWMTFLSYLSWAL